jgi:hypothetical protein
VSDHRTVIGSALFGCLEIGGNKRKSVICIRKCFKLFWILFTIIQDLFLFYHFWGNDWAIGVDHFRVYFGLSPFVINLYSYKLMIFS